MASVKAAASSGKLKGEQKELPLGMWVELVNVSLGEAKRRFCLHDWNKGFRESMVRGGAIKVNRHRGPMLSMPHTVTPEPSEFGGYNLILSVSLLRLHIFNFTYSVILYNFNVYYIFHVIILCIILRWSCKTEKNSKKANLASSDKVGK